jgi:hypothetical protein
MASTQSIISGVSFAPDTDIKYAKVKVNNSGGKSVGILNAASNSALNIQTPLMLTWGVNENTDKKTGEIQSYSMALQFPSEEYKTPSISKFFAAMQAFEAKINELYASGDYPLVDGYAPFCKHLFVPNFAGVKNNVLVVTPENEGRLRSGYEARTAQELAVLTRWFPKDGADEPTVARYMDIILYSREQINKEAAAMGREEEPTTAPWGIISIKAQDVGYELPMQPITMMRNALGKEEGGSGVPMERAKYLESVAFWSKHAPIK